MIVRKAYSLDFLPFFFFREEGNIAGLANKKIRGAAQYFDHYSFN